MTSRATHRRVEVKHDDQTVAAAEVTTDDRTAADGSSAMRGPVTVWPAGVSC